MNDKAYLSLLVIFLIFVWAIISVLYLKYAKKFKLDCNHIILFIKFILCKLNLCIITRKKNIKPKNKKKQTTKWFSFTTKKYFYLFFIIFLNLFMCYIVYFYAGFLVIKYTLLALKSKDIVTSIVQTFVILFRFIKINILRIKERQIIINKCNVVSIIPVYSETKDQIDDTINSIIYKNSSNNLDNLLCVICDGLDVNIEDSLTEIIDEGKEYYKSWKYENNELSITYGKIKTTPCMIMKKKKNQGKRDTLIVGHDIFNYPRTNIDKKNIKMRENVRNKVKQLYDLDQFSYMFCTDADSIIGEKSFEYLIETIEFRKAIACCGLVVIDFSEGPWAFWMIFQNFQYLYGQYIRRGTENLIGKVTCLPGCITMFKIHPVASKAIAMYSELPDENELIKITVQLLGTDRRLTCSFMFQERDIVIVYDIRAKCYTIPPNQLYSYISQRRRWGSNSYFNTFCMLIGPKTVHPITKIFAFLDYMRLSLVYFRIFNTVLFIYSMIQNAVFIELIPFLCIVLYPTIFFFAFALSDEFLRKTYHKLLLGYFYNKIMSPFISLMAVTNLYWNIGSTTWGGNQKETPVEKEENELKEIVLLN